MGKPIRNGRRRKKNSKACWKMPAVYRWATDKIHFEQRGSRCRMGVPPSTKGPVLLHATLRCRMFAGSKVSVLFGNRVRFKR